MLLIVKLILILCLSVYGVYAQQGEIEASTLESLDPTPEELELYNDQFRLACVTGNIDNIHAYFTLGATDMNGCLLSAVWGDKISAVRAMLDLPLASNGNEALQMACKLGRKWIVRYLLHRPWASIGDCQKVATEYGQSVILEVVDDRIQRNGHNPHSSTC